VNNITCRSLFAVLPSKTTPIERMPAVEDFDFFPDMGRKTPRLQLEERIVCSPAACERESAPRRS